MIPDIFLQIINDQELLNQFQKHQEDFKKMLEAGVFDFKRGQCIINRDENGGLGDIEIKVKTFSPRD